jgi:hypothetical protein
MVRRFAAYVVANLELGTLNRTGTEPGNPEPGNPEPTAIEYSAACPCGMLDPGIYPPRSQFEAWFISGAHTEKDLDRTRVEGGCDDDRK